MSPFWAVLIEMTIKGVTVDPITSMPIVILRDRDDRKVLPIWVGVAEANVVSQTASVTANTIDPQVVIPQSAWEYFEETARGNDADILVQRLQSALEEEHRRTIRFVNPVFSVTGGCRSGGQE